MTSLIRRSIFDPFFTSSWDDALFNAIPYISTLPTTPSLTVRQDGDKYTATMPLPGLVKEDVKVLVDKDVLTISYEKNDKDNSYVNTFSLSRSIPQDVEQTKIEARLENGVLTVELPKLETKKAKSRTVTVQ